jgi:peroxiredoxin
MNWLERIFGGARDMATLTAGTKAPEIALTGMDGKKFSLEEALKNGPVVAAFFKVSCPVCQYAFPFLERLHRAYGNQKIAFVGISQDDQRNTAAFLKEFGVSFSTLLDDPNGYAASNAYGLTNVPTWFLIGQDGQIEIASVGWVKADIEELNQKLSGTQQIPLPQLFKPGDDVRDFRAG